MDQLTYYGLKEHPFSNVVENRFYYKSKQHSEAIVKLKHAIETRRGLTVVVGDIGTGKTTLARRLLEELDETRYEAALLVIIHSSVTSDWLLRKFAMQLGVKDVKDDKIEIIGQIYKRLLEISDEGKIAVVLLDEVQMLRTRELMEEFRGLLNMELPDGKMVNFVFFGLPELDDILSLDEPLKQRVGIRITLKPFDEIETQEYIRHRLSVAGAKDSIFTPDAISMIYRYSRGIPRLINTICDNALLEGFLSKKKEIDKSIIETVVVDLGLNSEKVLSR